MRAFLSASALAIAIAIAAPGVVSAQGVSVDAGFTLTSRYMSSGIAQSKGAAFQPYIELGVNGFYAGLWASNVSLAPDSSEVDVYFGYRNEVGAFSYDIGYARYFYNSTGDCCGEIILSMGVAASDAIGLGVRIAHDPSAKVTNSSLSADFAVSDQVSLAAAVGKVSKGGQQYWRVGGSYALSDAFTLDLTYHDSDVSKGIAVLSLSYGFSLR